MIKYFPVICVLIVLGCFALLSCEQVMTKSFGGDMTIELPECQKLVVVTWKNSDLWYLTRDWRDGDFPETTTFHESSSYGIAEGIVQLAESCPRQ